jgi:competence protein ComGC
MVETTSRRYAEELRIIKGDEDVFESFTMVERLLLILMWPIGVVMFITTLIKKDDED